MTSNKEPIIVVEYDRNWQLEFKRIRDFLMSVLSELVIDIHHVGSTSVEGLAAKPILDIDVEIRDYDVFDEVVSALKDLGYIHVGDLGIENREAFKATYRDDFMDVHLYVCPSYSKELKRHITFRDYLRMYEKRKLEYAELKRKLSVIYRNNREAYTESKTDLILEIYKEIDEALL